MIRWIQITAALALATSTALAQNFTYVSSSGDEYSFSTNESGVVLRSLYPKAWFIENGANSRIEKGHDVIYLGRSCDAYHKLFGEGRWEQANGGFGVDFAKIQLRFPRQEIHIENGGGC